jgi:hypothetical protein
MYLYKDIVFLDTYEESVELEKYLMEMLDRKLALNEDILSGYGYSNITYDKYTKHFYIEYTNASFRFLHSDSSKTFYVPNSGVLTTQFKLSNMDYYVYEDDKKHNNSSSIIQLPAVLKKRDSITFCTNVAGNFTYSKYGNQRRRLICEYIDIKDVDELYYLGHLLSYQFILDVKKFVCKVPLLDTCNTGRTNYFTELFKVFQSDSWMTGEREISFSIIDLGTFLLKSHAYNIVSSYTPWVKDTVIVVKLNTNLRGKREVLRNNKIIEYKPRRLTFDESFDIIKQIVDKNLAWCIKSVTPEKKEVYLSNKSDCLIKLLIM